MQYLSLWARKGKVEGAMLLALAGTLVWISLEALSGDLTYIRFGRSVIGNRDSEARDDTKKRTDN